MSTFDCLPHKYIFQYFEHQQFKNVVGYIDSKENVTNILERDKALGAL